MQRDLLGVHLSMSTEPPVRITRVVLKNYKSIVACDVELRPLTILVGPNGSGKSNFLDALRFVSDSLTSGLDQAISSRGGIDSILSRVRLRDYLTIEIHWRLSPSASGCFGFDLGPLQDEGVAVYREWLRVDGDEGSPGGMRYTVRAKDAIDE